MESDRHTIAIRDWERERTRERKRKVGGGGGDSGWKLFIDISL